MRVYGTCEKCGLPVTAPETPAWPVTGWEIGRTKGANQIRLRERIPGRVRHATCVTKANEGQGRLL